MTHDFSTPARVASRLDGKPPKVQKLQIKFSASPRSLATEIRCQEKSKGGLRYEVILAEPNLTQVAVPKAAQQPAAPKLSSAEEIAEKLKAAEERRMVSNFVLEKSTKPQNSPL